MLHERDLKRRLDALRAISPPRAANDQERTEFDADVQKILRAQYDFIATVRADVGLQRRERWLRWRWWPRRTR
jgi:hypothetical protein